MKHRNIAKTRTIIKQGYIPESFISFYRAQLVPSILSDSLFDSMISKFRESLNIVIRIIKFDISHKISEELSEFINSQPSLECEKLVIIIIINWHSKSNWINWQHYEKVTLKIWNKGNFNFTKFVWLQKLFKNLN